MNLVLVAPWDQNSPRPGQYAAPALGVHRIADAARATGANVHVFDPTLDGVPGLVSLLKAVSPELVGFSTLAPTLKADMRLAELSRRYVPDALFMMGGQGVAGLESLLVEQGGLDVVCRGFGEDAVASIIHLFRPGRPGLDVLGDSALFDIANLTIRAGTESVSTRRALVTRDQFDAANRRLDFRRIPYSRYWEVNEKRYPSDHVRLMRTEGLLRTVRLITQSHCPLGCNYCSSTRFLDIGASQRQTVLMQSPEEIIATMERVLEAHPQTTTFYINDDDFVLQRHRALEFARLVTARFGERRFSFIAMTRVDHVDAEIARALTTAGFRMIFLGIETFAPQTLTDMEKNLRHGGNYTAMAREAVLTLLAGGIVPQIGLIPFYPSVRETDLLISVENAIDMVSQGARLSIFPLADAYPGASLFLSSHTVSTETVHIGQRLLKLPVHFLPADPSMRDLAEKVMGQHRLLVLRSEFHRLPQPVEGLHFLRLILREIGKSTDAADRALREFERVSLSQSGRILQYVNA